MYFLTDPVELTFLDKAGDLFDTLLELGTKFATWITTTEPVNYFVLLAFVLVIIGIVRSLVRR